jgi:dimethylglycine dehydrogenase
VKELWPLVNLGDGVDTAEDRRRALSPHDGHIAPVDLTMALRKRRARRRRDTEQTEVTASSALLGRVEGPHESRRHRLRARRVRDGNYARATGTMFGLNVPAIPVEHQYIVYDESPS